MIRVYERLGPQAVVAVMTVFFALVCGYAVSLGPEFGLLLIAAVGGAFAMFALPAAWLSAGGLVFILLFAALVPVNAAAAVLSFGPVGGVPLFAFVCVAVAGAALIRTGLPAVLRGGKMTVLAALFALLIVMSTVANTSPDLLVSMSNLSIWGSAFVLGLCLPARFVPLVLSAWIIVGVGQAAYAIYEFIARPPVLYGSLLPADYAIGETTTEASNLSRAQGTFGHPIPLGTFLATSFVLAMWAVKLPARPGLFWMRYAVLGLLAAGTLVTLSRSSWMVLAVVMLIALASRYASFATRLGLLALGILSVAVILQTPLGEGISGYVSNLGNTASFTQRSASLQSVPAILGAGVVSALFGFGAGSQSSLYSLVDLQSVGSLRVIDNQYITYLVEVGLVGLGVFLAILLAATFAVRKRISTSPESLGTRLVWGVWLALLVPLFGMFFYDGMGWPSTSILVWTMLGIIARFSTSNPKDPEERALEEL